jgi:TetR/AcrR family transcriptional regulator, transcriptional repressor of bet genes
MSQVEEKKSGSNSRTATRKARRQQLINATIDSISRRGFSGTTLETVTKGAKLSHGVVNFHFNSKEDLYIETLGFLADEHYACWHEAMVEAGADAATQLVAIVGANFDRKVCTPKKLSVWFAFWGQAKYRPNYLKMRQRHDDERTVELSRLCKEIVADGRYDQLDVASVVRSIEALVDGLWLNMLLYPKELSREKARFDCLSYFAQVFPKHFTRPDPDNPLTCSLVAG